MGTKNQAWDLMGGRFWREGRKSAKPSTREIDLYLGQSAGGKLLVVGASTRDLIAAAIERGSDVSVADFSAVMGRDLGEELGHGSFQFFHADILCEPEKISERFDVIVADRLINRFAREDLPAFFANCHFLLNPGGELRTSVKLGFYPMDIRLIDAGRESGQVTRFYDEATRTFNFTQARPTLETITIEHGDLPRDLLLEWYSHRGRESRFDAYDIDRALATDLAWQEVRREPFPDAPNTDFWIARRA